MADDFGTTAAAMHRDARTLAAASGWRNACYLAGYVVECVAKALIEATGNQPRRHHDLGQHSSALQYLALVADPLVGRYGDPVARCTTVAGTDGWNPNHRYDGTRWTENEWRGYDRDSDWAYTTLCQMYVDGVVGVAP